MKPFNLEQALAGKPVQLKEGILVKKVYYIPETTDGQQVMVVYEPRENDTRTAINFYDIYGNFNYPDTHGHIKDSRLDLFMVEEKIKGFVNIYKDQSGTNYTSSKIHETMEIALECRHLEGYVKTIEITI